MKVPEHIVLPANPPAGYLADLVRALYAWMRAVAQKLNALGDQVDAGGGGGGVPTSRLISTTAPLAGGGDLMADRTLSVATFGAGAAGVVPASGGGTTNFLRADGTWSATPGGAVDIKQTLATIPYGVQEARVTVTDAAVSPASQISVTWGGVVPTDENTPEMDPVFFSATAGSGQFDLLIASPSAFIGGTFRLNYLVG